MPPSPPSETLVGRPRVFGDYYLLATLARGGMGAIHLAKRVGFRPDIQMFCVVKTLRRSRQDPRELVKRFEEEARVVVTLNHRAICHVFDVGIVDDEHYIAMELIDGVSVRALWTALHEARAPLDPGIALYILDEVLDALAYAHDHTDPASGAALRIVHRDVSPQNVMVTFQGAVKLIDFGLVSSSLKSEKTENGMVVGKLAYMSPEQARGEPLDARTDVFAAAAVLYELVTGRRFYGDLSKGAIQLRLVEGEIEPSYEGVPDALVPVLRRALASEKEQRTASAAKLQAELGACGIPRASSRELRELLQRMVPRAQEELSALQRSFRDVGAAPPPSAHTQITHIARAPGSFTPSGAEGPAFLDDRATSSSSPTRPDGQPLVTPTVTGAPLPDSAASDATREHTPFDAPPGSSSSTPLGVARVEGARGAARVSKVRSVGSVIGSVAIAAGIAALLTGAWFGLRPLWRGDDGVAARGPVAVVLDAGGARAVPRDPRAANDAGPAPETPGAASVDAGVAVEARRVDESDAGVVVDAGTGAVDARQRRRVRSPGVQPPDEALPDLAAHFGYLERWCTARAPACTRRVLERRAWVPTLDVSGLRQLRLDAEACVRSCRRSPR